MTTRLPGRLGVTPWLRRTPLGAGAGTTDLLLYFRLAYLAGFAPSRNHSVSSATNPTRRTLPTICRLSGCHLRSGSASFHTGWTHSRLSTCSQRHPGFPEKDGEAGKVVWLSRGDKAVGTDLDQGRIIGSGQRPPVHAVVEEAEVDPGAQAIPGRRGGPADLDGIASEQIER